MPLAGPHHQTLSFLLKRFEEVGIKPVSRHGQNFLIDLNLVRLLVEAAELAPTDVVLEVGTGTGSLTALVAPHVAAVVTVEIDPRLHQLASEDLFEFSNVQLLHQDALRNKHTFDPRLLAVLSEQLSSRPGATFKLVANLPYNVATPIISNLLACPTPPVSMTITIQKEVADRITAEPGNKDYGALSIWIQSQCRTRVVRTLPPSVFWPRPKVTSAILHIELDEALRGRIPDLSYFHGFVRSLFFHRRKFLRSVLLASHKEQLGKTGVDRVLSEMGLSPNSRAEELDIPTVLRLAETMRSELADNKNQGD